MAISDYIGAEATRRAIARSISNIETMFVGIIQSVDAKNLKYNVQPILNRFDSVEGVSVESAILFECPMLAHKSSSFYLRVPYSVGDIVYVGVSKDSIDESLSGNKTKENKYDGVEQFRQIDGVILGGLLCETEERLSSDNIDDFLIQNRKNGDKFVLKKDSGIEFKTSIKVIVDSPESEFTGNVAVKGNINVAGDGTIGTVTTSSGVTLDGHTHQYNPGPGSPTPTSSGRG